MDEGGPRRAFLRSGAFRLAINLLVAVSTAAFTVGRRLTAFEADQAYKDGQIAQLKAQVEDIRQLLREARGKLEDLATWKIGHEQFSRDYVEHQRELDERLRRRK